MLLYYTAVVHKDVDSDFGVSFPDFPGCISAGATQSEALVMAKEALALQIEGLIEDKLPIPAPTSVDDVQSALARDDSSIAYVTLVEAALPGPAKRVNITIEEATLDEIDTAAASMGLSRSAFLTNAARDKLDGLLARRIKASNPTRAA
jgi:predicted RNase H-like HicB family nuclease